MVNIHKTAIVEKGAEIAEGCNVGPFCYVGSKVKLHKNVKLISSVHIVGNTEVGEGTEIFPFSVIGVKPQDLKYKGEETKIIIGKNTSIREHVTVHLATGSGVTSIGDNCLLMVACHVAHDVHIGNHVIIDNNVLLAGHVSVDDYAIIGGGSGIHQFCRIGSYAFIGGMSGVGSDIVPFALFAGVRDSERINGVNLIGLRRAGYSKEEIHEVNQAYDILFDKTDIFQNNIEKLQKKFTDSKLVNKIISFINAERSRNICTAYRKNI
ncbi:Acyl-[acyl-carrier-protein]--UDP-N- acetylglucosamine O-acyltransferase [Candidatus Hepatincola sp. Av]